MQAFLPARLLSLFQRQPSPDPSADKQSDVDEQINEIMQQERKREEGEVKQLQVVKELREEIQELRAELSQKYKGWFNALGELKEVRKEMQQAKCQIQDLSLQVQRLVKIQNKRSGVDEKWENQAASRLLRGLRHVLHSPGMLRAELPLAGGFRNFLRVAASEGFGKDGIGEEKEREDDRRPRGKSGFAVVVRHAGDYQALKKGCGGLQGLVSIAGGCRELLEAVGGIAVFVESVGGLKTLVSNGELIKVWGGFNNLVRDVGGYNAFCDAIGGYSVWAMTNSKSEPTPYWPCKPGNTRYKNFYGHYLKEAVIVKAMRDHWHVKWVTPLPPLPDRLRHLQWPSTIKIPLELTKFGERYSFELEIIKGNPIIFWGGTYSGQGPHNCIRGTKFYTSSGSYATLYDGCSFCRGPPRLPCRGFETPEIRQLLKQRPLKILLELDLRKQNTCGELVSYSECLRITCGKASYLISGGYSGPDVNSEYYRNRSERYYGRGPSKYLLFEGRDTEFRIKQTSGPVL
mmetsp:Transcript_21440/g.34681  ORF Transcript_21440/g.34681 Transcript_21440/m.34681 type:complete len:516 (-) Transcript_21440:143-1690(-)